MDSALFEEILIEEVRKHQNLWKISLTTFADKQAAQNSWEDVCKTLSNIKIAVTPDECRKKWKYLRDNFVKQKKKEDSRSGDPATSSVTWKYYKSLSFLKTTMKTTTSISSLRHSETTQASEEAEASISINEGPGEASNSINEGVEEEEEEDREPAAKMRRSVADERSEVLSCMRLWRRRQEATINKDSDGLENFGQYIASSLRKLRPELASQARFDISQVSRST